MRLRLAVGLVSAWIASMAAGGPATSPIISPSAPRVVEITQMLPAAPVGVGQPISNRSAWEKLAKTETFREAIRQAEVIAAQPIPVLTEEMYQEYLRNGNRSNWQSLFFQRRGDFTTLVMAECAENRGRFLAKIGEHIDDFCAMKTWVWPAHVKAAVTFNGIDLGVAEMSWQLSTARWLLGDRLTPERSAKILENVNRRAVKPYFESATGKGPSIAWMTRPNNWNAVCHACVVGSALATVPDRETRAVFIASAEQCMERFLDGFGSDGYCSEGLSYWNYGFGHYVLLAETIRQATNGRVDLMERPDVRLVAMFGNRIQIAPGVWPAFADCGVNAQPAPQLLRYVTARYRLASSDKSTQVVSDRGYLYDQILHAFVNPAALPRPSGGDSSSKESPLRTWFDQAGILVSRPKLGSACRIGAAMKGGNNAETHNHNDLGSFVVALDGDPVLLDPGAENYTARTFSSRRYESKLLNSFGHSVPLVAGELQRVGAEARAKILKKEFTDDVDTLVMDLSSAYVVPDLKRLERTFVYDRRGKGSLTVSDHAEFASPQNFGSALITLGTCTARGSELSITHDKHLLRVVIDASGKKFKVEPEVIKEDAPVTPTRVGINLADKATSATITLKITVP